jgi:hypothetical protein
VFRSKRSFLKYIALFILFSAQVSCAIEVDFKGQASGWSNETCLSESWSNQSGARYLPQLLFEQVVRGETAFDGEVMMNGFWAVDNWEATNSDLELYRLKFRFTTTRAEVRIGLQKINFGPAQLLRSLMWFDRLDPRDPLHLTDGVWGLLSRYYFQNNANIWLWGLFGNDEAKGYGLFPTAPERPEFGGRVQLPVPKGEVGISSHVRRVRAQLITEAEFLEKRIGLDGRWDVGVGLWFELVGQQWENDDLPFEFTKMITLGLDYTIGIGNGIYAVVEHADNTVSEQWWGRDEDNQISAYSLSYPVSMFDTVIGYGFYDWENRNYYQYVGWQRTYDRWIINPSLFWYPEDGSTDLGREQNYLGSGYGVQIIIIYNH